MRGPGASPLWRWFADSKIMNGDGTPRVMYHGTVNQFGEFGHTRKRHHAFGFHFGSLSQAEYFAGYGYNGRGGTWSGGHIRPVFLRIEQPLRTPDVYVRGRDSANEVVAWLIENGVISERIGDAIYESQSMRQAHERLTAAIEASGYDGIIYENVHEGGTWKTNEDAYIVFRAEQIRSVFEC